MPGVHKLETGRGQRRRRWEARNPKRALKSPYPVSQPLCLRTSLAHGDRFALVPGAAWPWDVSEPRFGLPPSSTCPLAAKQSDSLALGLLALGRAPAPCPLARRALARPRVAAAGPASCSDSLPWAHEALLLFPSKSDPKLMLLEAPTSQATSSVRGGGEPKKKRAFL